MSISIDPKLQTLFEHNYEEALRIARRLHSSIERLKSIFPLPALLDNLSEQQIDSIDAFRTRFADLQDCIGHKLFRSLLALEEEPTQSMLDVLNKMEKRRLIGSYQEWKTLRELRNVFSHDYPEAQAERSEALNMAFTLTPDLLLVLQQVHNYATQRLPLQLAEPPSATG